MTDISFCRWDTTILSENTKCCCPKPEICLNNDNKYCCKNCNWVQITGPPITKRKVFKCEIPNKYSSSYYFKQNNPNNCCDGQFNLKKNNQGKLLLINKNSRDNKIFGDISYPRSQRGRWNFSITNTKMHPITSVKANLDASGNTIGYSTASQSGNIFKNTHHNMSKKKLIAYLSKHRAYLRR